MNIKKFAFVALLLCAASVAFAAPDEIFTRGGTNAERSQQKDHFSSEELVQADASSAEFELPVIESSIPLIQAAKAGDAKEVRRLILRRAEIDAHEENGITSLMAAVLYSHERVIDELLAGGANVNAASRAGWTPLMFAIFIGAEDACVEKLITHGADLNAEDAVGRTPLMIALRAGKPYEFIEKFIERGAYPERRAKDGTSPMMIACAYAADPEIVRLLYEKGADIAIPNKAGDTPLHFVARNSSDAASPIAKFLMKNRAPLPEKNGRGATPLMTAAEISSRPDLVDAILEADWRVDTKNRDGMTALMLAAGNPTPAALEIARRLADAGANFATTDERGRNAFLVALSAAHSLETVRWLKASERGNAERNANVQLTVQPAVKTVADAAPIVIIKPKSDENDETETEISESAEEAEKIAEVEGEIPAAEKSQISDGAENSAEAENKEEIEKEPRVKTLAFPSKAQNSRRKSAENAREISEAAPLANVSLASHHISDSSLRFALVEKSGTMRPFKKRREMKKARISRKKDPVLVPPLLLAAVNRSDAAPEIIDWLLERGEDIESRDTEGRTALICAVRYNSSPLAARALLERGANPRVAFKKSSLLQLLRYNESMENDDKEDLAKFIREAKKK